MMSALIRAIRFAALTSTVALASGCATTLQTPDLNLITRQAADAEQSSQSGAISISEMLSRARGQSAQPNGQTEKTLELRFTSRSLELTASQQDALNRYANTRPSQTLQVDCAPSATSDPVTAASVAVSRCIKVSRFLEKRTHTTAISLQPTLEADQIRVSESE